jgi:hypothetical protein
MLLAAGLLLGVVATPGLAQNGSGKPGRSGKSDAAVEASVSIRFGDADVRVIRDYYHNSSHRPKPLPPGIAKNLARGKPLPPGIAKRALPADLHRRLTRRDGVEHVLTGDKVVMVRAGVVIDIVAIFH